MLAIFIFVIFVLLFSLGEEMGSVIVFYLLPLAACLAFARYGVSDGHSVLKVCIGVVGLVPILNWFGGAVCAIVFVVELMTKFLPMIVGA